MECCAVLSNAVQCCALLCRSVQCCSVLGIMCTTSSSCHDTTVHNAHPLKPFYFASHPFTPSVPTTSLHHTHIFLFISTQNNVEAFRCAFVQSESLVCERTLRQSLFCHNPVVCQNPFCRNAFCPNTLCRNRFSLRPICGV